MLPRYCRSASSQRLNQSNPELCQYSCRRPSFFTCLYAAPCWLMCSASMQMPLMAILAYKEQPHLSKGFGASLGFHLARYVAKATCVFAWQMTDIFAIPIAGLSVLHVMMKEICKTDRLQIRAYPIATDLKRLDLFRLESCHRNPLTPVVELSTAHTFICQSQADDFTVQCCCMIERRLLEPNGGEI